MTSPVFVTVSSGVAVSVKSTSKTPGDQSESSIWPPTVEQRRP